MTDRINKLRELFFANAHKAYRVEDLGLSILNEETPIRYPQGKGLCARCRKDAAVSAGG